MKRLIILLLAGGLFGCASARRAVEITPPTYAEKVGAQSLAKVDVSCPAEIVSADWRTLVPQANACVKAGQWVKVERLGDLIATGAPIAPWGAYYLSLAASARGDLARAQWMLELALKKAPDQPIFHFELARLYWQLGDEAGVAKQMKRAADQSPDLGDAHLYLGQMALRRADVGEARRELGAALAAEPASGPALLVLAETELTANDFAAAEEVLTRAIKASPRHAGARLALAEVQEVHLKKTPEALETLREIAKLGEQNKLDQAAPGGLHDRIRSLEKTLSQVRRDDAAAASPRQPSAERQVQQ